MCGQFGLFGCIPFTFSPLSSPGHQTLWHVTCSISRYLYYHQDLNIIYNCQHLGKSLLSHITNVVSIVVLLTEKAKRLYRGTDCHCQQFNMDLAVYSKIICMIYGVWGDPWWNGKIISTNLIIILCILVMVVELKIGCTPQKLKVVTLTHFFYALRKCVSTELSYGKYVRMVRNHNIWYVWYT